MGGGKMLGPLLGGLGAAGGLTMTAMGMPELGVPLMTAGIGSGLGGGLGGGSGALTGGLAGAGVGMGAESMGAGGLGIPGLAAKLGIGTPSAAQLSSALANNPAMKGIDPSMVQSFGPPMPPAGYNPAKASALGQLGLSTAGAGLSPVIQAMNQPQQSPFMQPPPRQAPPPMPAQPAATPPTVPQFQAPAVDPIAKYLRDLGIGVG